MRVIADGEKSILWKLGKSIGEGEFSKVYLAMDIESGEMLAVKSIPLSRNREISTKIISQIRKEVNILKHLDHPNIIHYYQTDIDFDINMIHILIEYVSGENLKLYIDQFCPLPEKVIARFVSEILTALDYLHKKGVIHRDLKSTNILLTEESILKLSDFGLSKLTDKKTTSNDIVGSPYWMAPEILNQEKHSFSADIWSLGCTIIEMLTGRPPWSNKCKTTEQVIKYVKCASNFPDIPKCSNELFDFLNKCFSRSPILRPTAEQLLQHEFLHCDFRATPGMTTLA